MRKIRSLFLVIFFALLCGLPMCVLADVYKGEFYDVWWQDSGVGVFATDVTGNMDYNGWYIKSTIDDGIYYCIDPAYPLKTGTYKSEIAYKEKYHKLDKKIYERINLLSFYGYDYQDKNYDHSSKKWYGITQVMIWKTVRPDLKYAYKSSRYGNVVKNLYEKEEKEIEELVSSHYDLPSFANKKYKIFRGEELVLKDNNGVLDKFYLSSSANFISMDKSSKNLKIVGKKIGKSYIKFTKLCSYPYFYTLYYGNPGSQNVIQKGKFNMFDFDFFVQVVGTYLNIRKVDSDTGTSQGDASFKGAVYDIYDSSDKLVKSVVTDDKGNARVMLDNGSYKVKERVAPLGYKLSDKVYEVSINNEDSKDLVVSDEVIKGNLIIKKYKGGVNENFVLEDGAVFDVFDSSGKVVDTLTTENGVASVSLPFGKYKFVQTSSFDGYASVPSFEVDIDENKDYLYELKDVKYSEVVVYKKDKVTKVGLEGTKISLYDENDKLVSRGITDDKGILRFSSVKIGNYYLTEDEAPLYYRLNDEKIGISVLENGMVVNKTIYNERNIGNIKIVKSDKKNGSFLSGAYFEIFMDDDMVFKGETDKNGEINLNDVRAGKYCVYERLAPFGYVRSSNPICFELLKDGESITIDVTNCKKVRYVVPNTYKGGNFILVILIFFLIIISSIVIVRRKNEV
ncbi:MAG: SpaA isopeptide-forming pilin-related protein [bacterium]|nr:SpaA isopeptide-forming pilin-related protein [bacterium]